MAFGRFHPRYAFEHIRRYRHIMSVLMKYGFEEVADALRSRFSIRFGEQVAPVRVKSAAKGRTRAERTRLALQDMGPTFIKMGQLLSTRPDIIPDEYICELEKLQDQVVPVESSEILAELERELEDKVDSVFSSFEKKPLAAGSIAQVHRARTKQGEEVVLKIRRPGIKKTVQAECQILEDLAGLLKTTLFARDTIDPQKMIREITEAIFQEVDLASEKRNQVRFIKAFADDETIHVPVVYEEYCTEGLLVMEYIDGIKAVSRESVEARGLNPKLIARRASNFVLKQIFDFGFFHTDPHTGNFLILPENVLVPIDFGQVAFLSSQDRRFFSDIVLTIVDNDTGRLIRSFEQNDLIGEKTDINRLNTDIEQILAMYSNLPLKDLPFGRVAAQIFRILRRHNVRPPTHFTLMLKSMMTVENFAHRLDPDFNLIEILKPYSKRFVYPNLDPVQAFKNLRRTLQGAQTLASRLPEDFNAILSKFRQGRFQLRVHHEHLENLATTLNKSSNRVSFALIIAALLVSSSMLVTQQGTILGLALQSLGMLGYLIAAVMGLGLLISILRGRKY